ncbi:hypothetical protein [Asticcacaulis sp. EMRT-3]|uniref:hypothetical protein n=1 Tax=Asticcacaulis sp. EMRT-3 TaxID=3040349 RepID=UPI0024AFC473|nr:hypothetical protein [Asticcacaulis sp. EMRT-3]MDI7774436.1 hypothetical protein [Asticcacaulis sp. EMRT-3]
MPSPAVLIGLTFGFTVCLAGLIFGYWRERMGALIYLAAMILTMSLRSMTHIAPLWRYMFTDTLCLVGFLTLCWKSPHPWPLWAVGAQMMSVCVSLATWLNPYVMKWAYFTALSIFGYALLLAMGVGTISAALRRFRPANKIPKIG